MPRASLRSVLLICAFSTACMCRVSTQTTGNSASARALNSHCDSGPASNPIRSKDEKRRDEFLSRSLLRHGSDVHAALNELSVVREKIDAQHLRGHPKHGHEDPRLPIVERTCRNEQAREQNCERYQVG